MASGQRRTSRRLGWPGLVGIVVSILGLWWAVHDVSLSDLVANARNVRPFPFALAITAATLAFPLRTVRWRYLLQVDGRKLPFLPLWHATAIGFMANNLLPARAGEVARIYAAGKLTDVTYSASLASIAIERVFDGLVMLALMAIAMSMAGFSSDITVGGISVVGFARTFGIAFALLLGVAAVAVRTPDLTLRIAHRLTHSVLPDRWADRIEGVVTGLLSGMSSLTSPRRFVNVLFWSFAVWFVNGSSFWLGFVAFGIDVPFSGAFILQAVIGFGVAVPQAPGYVGVFEAAIRGTLALYAVHASVSVAYAMLYHVAGFIPITLLGLYSLGAARLHLADLKGTGENDE